MGIGLFTDKAQQPTDTQVLEAIGSRLPLWHALVRFVREQYPVQEDFKYLYGKNYGWALRFRVKGKLLVSLYPTQGGFTTQVNLSSDAVEQAQRMRMSKNVRQAMARARPYPEGRWLFIPVESENDVRDIQRLLALRVDAQRLQTKA